MSRAVRYRTYGRVIRVCPWVSSTHARAYGGSIHGKMNLLSGHDPNTATMAGRRGILLVKAVPGSRIRLADHLGCNQGFSATAPSFCIVLDSRLVMPLLPRRCLGTTASNRALVAISHSLDLANFNQKAAGRNCTDYRVTTPNV